MPAEIVIFGKNGQVAHELKQRLSKNNSICFKKITVLSSQDADFTSPDTVVKILQQLKPDIIINAAAYTAVDKAENEIQKAYLVNSETPAKIAAYAKQNNSLLIHYSTDFVFDGEYDRAYLESDTTHPLGVYGASKLQGDINILQSGCQHLIFRTSWVYGLRGNNFLLTMLRLAHERETMSVVNDQFGSPTWCGHIAETTVSILEQLLTKYPSLKIPSASQGIYNLSASNYTSWFDFASQILQLGPNREKQLCHTLSAIPATDYPTPAQRPRWSVLNNDKIIKQFAISIPSWEEQLEQCFKSAVS